MVLQLVIVCSFSLLNIIFASLSSFYVSFLLPRSSYKCDTIRKSVTYFLHIFWEKCNFLLLGIFIGVASVSQRVVICSALVDLSRQFLKNLVVPIYMLTLVHENSSFPKSSPILGPFHF